MDFQKTETTVISTFFTPKGRLNRRAYILRSLAFTVFMIITGSIVALIIAAAGGAEAVAAGVAILTCMPFMVAIVMLDIRRLHDLNKSGWWFLAYTILVWVPYINIVVSIAYFIYTWFIKGTVGPNRFGMDPLQNLE